MTDDRKIKRCVGPIIYNLEGKIFLMKSPKWRQGPEGKFGEVWTVPGGEIEKDETGKEIETPEAALRREIREELGMELSHIEHVGEGKKSGETDFIKPNIDFEFIDFVARTENSTVTPNSEISKYDWFTLDEAEALPMIDVTKKFLIRSRELVEKRIAEFKAEYKIDNR